MVDLINVTRYSWILLVYDVFFFLAMCTRAFETQHFLKPQDITKNGPNMPQPTGFG